MELLGGISYRNGVSFITERHIATALYMKDGSIDVSIVDNKISTNKGVSGLLMRIPFLRGLVLLIQTLMLSRFAIFVILVSIINRLLPPSSSDGFLSQAKVLLMSLPLIALIILLVMLKTVIGKYHGAEHMVFSAYENNSELTVSEVLKNSRISDKCGTNLLLIFLLVTPLLFMSLPQIDPFASILIGWSITYEIRNYGPDVLLKPFFWLGGKLQFYFLTSAPDEKHIRVAISALLALKNKEGAV